ncbi:hypothetical protein V2J09_006649 [Rumex salicifolius]
MSAENSGGGKIHLVAVAYPGRGHINPMINLCRLIAAKSPALLITLVVTEEWRDFLTDGSEPEPPPNLRLGVVAQVVPSAVGRAASFPSFVEAVFTKLEEPVERLVEGLEPPVTAMVYDIYLFWAVRVGSRLGIPVVAAMCPGSTSMLSFFCHFDLLVRNGHFPLQISERGSEVVNYIPGLAPTSISDLPTVFDGDGAKIIDDVLQLVPAIKNTHFLLLTSIPELEGPAVDALQTKFPATTVLPIGPLIPYSALPPPSADYLRWLDSQLEGSVLYVSMGSFLSPSAAQTDEIVAGIVDSGVSYLWVTRGDEYSRRLGTERGCLVRWCDQLRVLSHPAVGGFWSHCGWNSSSEAMFAGVPMLTCPVIWDQTLNGKMAAEDWRIGRRVIKSSGFVTRVEIAKIVREFMDPVGEGRAEVVAAVKRLSHMYRTTVGSGGSAASNLDAFVRRISPPLP